MTSYRNEAIPSAINLKTITPAYPRPVLKTNESDDIHTNEAVLNCSKKYSSKLALIIILLIAMDMI
ncbi:MAG: hypothetical protein E7235_04130 [Lachnospiraceae bacterium]|nr:hypothetical protein [Lachnospiraceae bacterium]